MESSFGKKYGGNYTVLIAVTNVIERWSLKPRRRRPRRVRQKMAAPLLPNCQKQQSFGESDDFQEDILDPRIQVSEDIFGVRRSG